MITSTAFILQARLFGFLLGSSLVLPPRILSLITFSVSMTRG